MKKTILEDIKRIKDLMFKDEFLDDNDIDSDDEIEYEEMTEEGEETSSTTPTSSQGYPTVGKWESGRTFGPTYKFPYSKWDNNGLVRGKANKLV